MVKSLLAKCVTCKAILGKANDNTYVPPLPPFRASKDATFSQIGVDFTGPLYVRHIYGHDKQSCNFYIALFSCASTRAIQSKPPRIEVFTRVKMLHRQMWNSSNDYFRQW